MTLMGALQLGSSSLAAQQTGLSVTGNNITNAGSPGYSRETVDLVPSDPTELQPGIQLGTGVTIQTINRAVSESLNASLRNANSDQSAAGSLDDSLSRLQDTFGTLNSDDLAANVQSFFNQFSTLANNPSDAGQRSVVIQAGVSLAGSIQDLRTQVSTLRDDTQTQIQTLATQANTLVSTIASLNKQITTVQGGGGGANTLLDQRDSALSSLSQIMNITTVDQGNGSVNVLVGSVPIVTGNTTRGISTNTTPDPTGTYQQVNLAFADNGDTLNVSSGSLAGLINARDNHISTAINTLDTLAGSLISTVNSISSQGQGLSGFSSVSGTVQDLNPAAALNAGKATTNLDSTPVNGTFNLNVKDLTTGAITTQQIQVNLSGTGTQTTLSGLAASLTSGPIVASVNPDGTLKIASTSSNNTFTFSDDTSGVLSSLGINTIFTGNSASNIGVNNTLITNPDLLASGRNNVAGSNQNAQALAQAYTASNSALGGQSIQNYYAQFATNLASQTSAAHSDSTSQTAIQATISAQQQAFSGVSINEEAINLTKYQQAFQGTARYINVVNTFMDTVLSLIQE